ncbi:MAG: hypothetical protein H0W78_17670 [Planctomycetes bacterium]|jgi:hypothetical protein|nr:hypothetical protein [Planctomycetota bacterium]
MQRSAQSLPLPTGRLHGGTTLPIMLIKPLTVRLIAYGEKANLAAIRTRAVDLLTDEHGKLDPKLITEVPGTEVHAEIIATRLDPDPALKKPTAKKPGIAITLPEMNEKTTVEWLHELPLAKTVVVFATWTSHRENMDWQLLAADGSRWSESRPHA